MVILSLTFNTNPSCGRETQSCDKVCFFFLLAILTLRVKSNQSITD